MARRPRHISQEEKDLWDLVAKRVTKLDPTRKKIDAPEAMPAPLSKKREPVAPSPLPKFRVGQKSKGRKADDLAAPIADALRSAPLSMDHKTHRKMTRGKIVPDGKLDLHGMTIAEAHSELIAFVLSSFEMERRLLLVITGKGKDRDEGGPIPTRMGVLRHQVPQWLRLPPLNHVVLQVTPAHARHGGHGAYYIYLKRVR
ncbi:Smr/MutS family protein [Marivivens aquimaris]|uniref:Smr/MutS family protein n=1 Tax=Marivivens aquimaris TaxID=2774876 RepID=UPI001882B9AD|nr:Smr/MutS family protein [Marivivens aquimaris]